MDYKSTLMWKELNEAKDVLKTLRERNAGVLQSVAAAAEKAGVANVYTAARGTSDHAMIFLKYLIEGRLGIPVASGAPSAVTMYGAKMKFSNALVIGCSQSGKAADVMEIVRAGNESGAVTVAITNDEQSPLQSLHSTTFTAMRARKRASLQRKRSAVSCIFPSCSPTRWERVSALTASENSSKNLRPPSMRRRTVWRRNLSARRNAFCSGGGCRPLSPSSAG